MENPFIYQSAAKRYAESRPRIHETALRTFREASGCSIEFHRALDVACGTGQSTTALANFSRSVVGADVSMPMLSEAQSAAQIEYVCAAAEGLPFRRSVFDLVSVGLAFHWFEQSQFLAEANRVIETNQWLVLYNSWFSGDMEGVPSFQENGWGKYLMQFPSPPRKGEPITEEIADTHGFEYVGSWDFEDWISMSKDELILYFSTQSNVVLPVEKGNVNYEEVERRVNGLIRPFFTQTRHQFRFPGTVWCLAKRGSA